MIFAFINNVYKLLKITCTQADLSRALRAVARAVGNGKTHPILSGVLLNADGGSLQLTTYDLSIGIQTSIDAAVATPGAAVVPHRLLADITGHLDGDSAISMTLDGDRIALATAGGSYSLSAASADDFPGLPAVAAADGAVIDLAAPLAAVIVAASNDEAKQVLTGIHLVSDGTELRMEATDGHRLAFSQIVTEQEFARQEVIIPRKTILELQRLLEETDDEVKLAIATNQVKFDFSNIELISKLVEGKFPDYTRVIPKAYKNNFTLNREALLRSLQRAAIMTSDKFKGVRCLIEPGSLKISSTNADQEEAVEELEIEYAGDAIDIGFNVTYLLDVLNNLKSDTISISLGDANSSALVTIPDDPNFKYVVMPMRI